MAGQEQVRENDSGGFLEMIGAAISGVVSMAGKAWDAVMADGTIEAAGRQGIDELGMALRAFPESIQVAETGSIWNPTQGEVAADRADTGRAMWPSEVAEQNRHQPVHDAGQAGHEHDAGYSM